MTNSGKSEQNELCACPAAHTPFFVRFDTEKKNRKEKLLNTIAQLSFLMQRQYNTVRERIVFFDFAP